MRTQAIALATATGALLGCGEASDFQWGIPYQATGGPDEDDDDPPPDDDDHAEASSDEGGPEPPDAESGGGSVSGPDPTLPETTSVGESSSTGEPEDSADTGETPYQGGWDVGDCQEEMVSDVADFYLTDSYGDQIRLYDFCHKAILLTAGSFW